MIGNAVDIKGCEFSRCKFRPGGHVTSDEGPFTFSDAVGR